MRKFGPRLVSIPAGKIWPDTDGGMPLPWFRYWLVENRTAPATGGDIWVGFDARPSAASATSADFIVPAGTGMTRSVAGEIDEEGDAHAVHSIWLLNTGGSTATVLVELDEDEIKVSTWPSITAGDVVEGMSNSDNAPYDLTIGHRRELQTDLAEREYMMAQLGRQLFRDDFESGVLKWSATVGAAALDNARSALKGAQSMKLTTGAVAGAQAVVHKFHTVPADQGFTTSPQVILECWIRPADANWRDFQMFIRPDDTVQRWEGALRYFQRNTGVLQNVLQYLDGNGNFQTLTAWPIADGAGAESDPWHHIMLVMNYHNGASGGGGYFNYALAKFDDFTAKIFNASATGAAGHAVASNGRRESETALLVTTDAAAATSLHVDELEYCDLSGARQL